jgi:hypothetical protein
MIDVTGLFFVSFCHPGLKSSTTGDSGMAEDMAGVLLGALIRLLFAIQSLHHVHF